MMLILLRTSGFLVSVTIVLNSLYKKIHFFQFYFQSSHCMLINTAYRRLLNESPEEIRKLKYTNKTTVFSLQKYFKCQEGNNHWTFAQIQKQVSIYSPLFQFPLPIVFLSLALVLCLTLFVFVFYGPCDLKVL